MYAHAEHLRKVETVTDGGNLLKNLALIESNSWQTSKKVFADWQAGVQVQGTNTANLAVYRLVKGEPVLDLLAKKGNLFLEDRFRQKTYEGILNQEFFIPSGGMLKYVMSAITAGKSVKVPYSGLNVENNSCWDFIEVNAKNESDEKKLIYSVYGIEEPGNGRKIFLLSPDKVKKALGHNIDDVVVRACFFYYNRDFFADDRNLKNPFSSVRGLRRKLSVKSAQR